jgi:hypothetical protein
MKFLYHYLSLIEVLKHPNCKISTLIHFCAAGFGELRGREIQQGFRSCAMNSLSCSPSWRLIEFLQSTLVMRDHPSLEVDLTLRKPGTPRQEF